MKTLQLQLRFLIPLLVALVVAALVVLPLMDQLTLRWFSRDLNTRGTLVAGALADAIDDAISSGSSARLQALFDRAARDERLVAIAMCNNNDELVRHSAAYPVSLKCADAREASRRPEQRLELPTGAVHVGVHPASNERPNAGTLVLLHDLSFIDRRSQDTRQYLVVLITGLGLVISLITVIVAQLSWRGWVMGMRAILRGEGLDPPAAAAAGAAAVGAEVRARLRDLEDEFRRTQGLVTEWNPERLRALLHTQLRGDQVIVVSNREPYIHEHRPSGVIVKRPASGLVTAVEPVMRACSGTWIAHGSGSADRDVVDARDSVGVPPGARLLAAPHLAHRRGGAGLLLRLRQRGLWPLCHVAHVRPMFRESDWEQYRIINQRFADAVVQEARGEDPVVLVQDYHFALLPQMIREQLPRATILDVLAHPVAEPGVVRHLPVAARDPAGHAGQHHPRLSHALPLQELHRDGRPLPRGAHRARALDDLVPGQGDAGRELSDLDRVADARRWPPAGRRWPNAGGASSSASGCRRTPAWRWASTASTTPRASSSA